MKKHILPRLFLPVVSALVFMLVTAACGAGPQEPAAVETAEAAAISAADLTGVWDCDESPLINRVYLYEDGSFGYNVYMNGEPLGDMLVGTCAVEGDKLTLSIPDNADWLYFDIVQEGGALRLMKSGVDEFIRTGDIAEAPAEEPAEEVAEEPAEEVDTLLEIENQLQGTWYSINGEGTMEEYLTFAAGEYSNESYYNGEKLGDTRYGTYYVTYDSIPVATANSDGRMVEGELLYSFENGTLALLSRTGGSVQKLYDGPALTERSGKPGGGSSASRTSASAPENNTPRTTPSAGQSTGSRSSAASLGEQNALASARQYLAVMAFSYDGLIDQLEYEGYTHSEAVYAVDNCGADWYEQAALSAREYLDLMPFSRSELISQLEYEGFTNSQAVYGVEQNGY